MKKIIIIALSITLCILTIGCNNPKLDSLKHNQDITISGKITLIGNAPFQQTALLADTHQYTLPLIIKHNNNKKLIQENMGKKLTLTGKLQIKDFKTADLKKTIREIKLIVEKIKI